MFFPFFSSPRPPGSASPTKTSNRCKICLCLQARAQAFREELLSHLGLLTDYGKDVRKRYWAEHP